MTKAESGQMRSQTLKQPSKFKLFTLHFNKWHLIFPQFSLLWQLCADRGIKSRMMVAYEVSKIPNQHHILKKAELFDIAFIVIYVVLESAANYKCLFPNRNIFAHKNVKTELELVSSTSINSNIINYESH